MGPWPPSLSRALHSLICLSPQARFPPPRSRESSCVQLSGLLEDEWNAMPGRPACRKHPDTLAIITCRIPMATACGITGLSSETKKKLSLTKVIFISEVN